LRLTRTAALLALILAGQFALIIGPSPYYSLYYNTLLFFGRDQQTLFQLPEPAYGLNIVSNYIRSHAPDPKVVLTDVAPHLVHDYLADYNIVMDRELGWSGDPARDLSIVLSFQVSYVIIGTFAMQIDNSTPLMRVVTDYGNLVLRAVADGIPVAYLYIISRPTIHSVAWTPSATTNWTLTNSNGTFESRTYQGQVDLPCQFSSGYPPSEWVKATFRFSLPLNATYLRFTSTIDYHQVTQVTTTLTVVDSKGVYIESVLIGSSGGFLSTYAPDVALASLKGSSPVDLSSIISIQLTVYNAQGPAAGDVVMNGMELVS